MNTLSRTDAWNAKAFEIGPAAVGLCPKLVAVLGGDRNALDEQLRRVDGERPEIVEFRHDLVPNCASRSAILESIEALTEIKNRRPMIGTILTLRRFAQGGNFRGSEAERLRVYLELLPLADSVDIEIDAWEIRDELISEVRRAKRAVIVSYHNRLETPQRQSSIPGVDTLEAILDLSRDTGADLLKIVAVANSIEDVRALTQFTSESVSRGCGIHLATISGGKIGSVSRLINPLFGSCLTYCDVGSPAFIPGILPIERMREFFDLLPKNFTISPTEIKKAEPNLDELLSTAGIYGWTGISGGFRGNPKTRGTRELAL